MKKNISNGEIENNLLGFINQIKELLNTKKIDNSTTLAKDIENNKNFLFKPLEDIPAEKEKKEVKRNGFIVYSRETIKSHLINRSETLENRFECIYKKCKNYEKINESENYIYRYYYYRELEYKNKKRPLKELATIIMINPAFASSKDDDSTINNICNFLEKLNFKSFEIVNLYPIRLPKPNCLDCFNQYLNFDERSYHNFLKKYLQNNNNNNNELIAAWGKEYNKKAKEIFKNSGLKFKTYKMGEPAHFSSSRFNNINDKGLYDFPIV